jgi:hypothetical protein
MHTTDREPAKSFIRRPRTWQQKVREMVLVLFDVEKKDISAETGVDRGVMTNIFSDKHRSPAAESKVLDFLNGRLMTLGQDERRMLRATFGAGVTAGITRNDMGWPLDETVVQREP